MAEVVVAGAEPDGWRPDSLPAEMVDEEPFSGQFLLPFVLFGRFG